MVARSRPGTGTNQGAVRRHNLGTLLGHVHRSGGVSRAQLTEWMGLNRSTIADLVRELEDLSSVRQSSPDLVASPRVGAGRPSFDVKPDPESVFVVAAELGVDTMDVARVGLGGMPLDRTSTPTPTQRDPEGLVDTLVEMLRAMVKTTAESGRLVGVGVAVPGVVTDSAGLVRFAPNLGWSDVDLRGLLAERIGPQVPVRLGNDAELGALAEHTRGAAKDHSNLIFLSCDVGVGGGVIVAGAPMMGASGYAGEVGHLVFDPRGQTCRCGNVGCWETEIGSHAVAEAVGCPTSEIHRLADFLRPDAEVTPALRSLGRALGLGLGGLVNVFNPEMIILGGVLRWVFPLVRDDVLESLQDWALRAPAEQAEIVLPSLGGDSVIVGAAELAFTDLFHDPVEALGRADGVVDQLLGA